MLWQLGYSVCSVESDNMTHLQAGVEETADTPTLGVTGSYGDHFVICSEPSQ